MELLVHKGDSFDHEAWELSLLRGTGIMAGEKEMQF